jgi:DnaJ-class molecular chaperone
MKEFSVKVSQAGGEYYGIVKVRGEKLELKGHRKIKVDGVEIEFEGEYIADIATKILPKKIKCFRCNGKGGYEQMTGFSEDDTAWDLCPECNGTGEEK